MMIQNVDYLFPQILCCYNILYSSILIFSFPLDVPECFCRDIRKFSVPNIYTLKYKSMWNFVKLRCNYEMNFQSFSNIRN